MKGWKKMLWIVGMVLVVVTVTKIHLTKAESPGFDGYEQNMLNLINSYRQSKWNCPPVIHDNDLQTYAEDWAHESPAPGQHSPNSEGEILANVSDSSANGDEAADEALLCAGGSPFCWDRSEPHQSIIKTCFYTEVGIGHVKRDGDLGFGNNGWFWVVKFGGSGSVFPTPTPVPLPPRLVLTGDVYINPNPVMEGQPIEFQIPVQNVGGQNLNLHYVGGRVQTAQGGIWEIGGDFNDLAPGGTATFTIRSGQNDPNPPIWPIYGTWRIQEIVYRHGNEVWASIEANNHLYNGS